MSTESTVPANKQKRTLATYVLATSIFCLSGALFYFTWTLSSISDQIPAILTSAEHTSSKIEPVLQQANDIKDLIPPILDEVRETRKLVIPILEEVRLTREQIPEILHQVEETRKQIPAILQTTKKVVAESQAIRPLIPKAINEVKLSREAIPPALDRADALVANVRKAGKEASQGAVTGLFTGIIAAPFELIGNFGKRMLSLSDEEIKELSKQDLEMIKRVITELLPSDDISKTRSWKNPDTNISGDITLIKIDTIDDRLCKEFHVKIRKKKQTLVDKNTMICLNDDGEWEKLN